MIEMLKNLPFMLEVESQEPDGLFADKVDLFKICYECDGCRVMGFAAFPKDIPGEIPAVIFNRGGNREFGILHPNAVCRLAARGYAALGSQYRGNAGGTGLEEFGGADVNDVIRFLRQREIVHFQRFGEALGKVQDRLNSKNFYAMNPAFDK